MTSENKISIVIAFGLLIFVSMLVADHFSSATDTPIATLGDNTPTPPVVTPTPLRDGSTLILTVNTPNQINGDEIHKVINGETSGYAGVSPDRKVLENYRVIVKYSFINSIHQSVLLTYHYSVLTFKMIYKLFTGQANVNNISGPLSIAEFTGKSLSMGIVYFAYILAILSISLGVLNLLPIPVLDGGHLVFYLFEMLIGKPVPENIQHLGQQIGIIILFGIMILAFYNDFLRIF